MTATFTACEHSIAPIVPSTRTSITRLCSFNGNNEFCSCCSIQLTCCCQLFSNNSSMLALATAHANALPIKVGPCIKQPASPLLIVCAISFEQSVAAKVMQPPVNVLPKHITSGLISAHSQAKSFPVRPNPVAISSTISKTSY